MNALVNNEVLWGTDHIQEHRGNPSVATLPEDACFNEQTWVANAVASGVSDEARFPTFCDGAGI
jgi:hypothetical protein